MKSSIRHIISGFALACALHSLTGPTLAETPQEKAALIPIKAFSQLPAMSSVKLSPKGGYLAYKTAQDGRTFLAILNRTEKRKVLVPPVAEANIAWHRWTSEDGMLISYSFENYRAERYGAQGNFRETRLGYYDVKKDNFDWVMKQRTQKQNNFRLQGETNTAFYQDLIIDFLPDEPDYVLQAIDSDLDGDTEIRKLNVTNGRYKEIFAGMRGAYFWMTDRNHDIRFGYGIARAIGEAAYYKTTAGRFVNVTDTKWYKDDFWPITFTDNPAIVYADGPSSKGTRGLFKLNLDTDEVLEEVFAHDTVDVDGLVYKNPAGDTFASADELPVAVAYTHDRPEVKYFDEYAAKLQGFIDRALPNTVNTIVSQLPDLRQYVIHAGNANDAGIYYILDLKKKSLDALAETMPGLMPDYMAKVKPVSYEARDGTSIPGYLTLPTGAPEKNLPTVLLVHGGPWARDDMRFDTWVQFLASRGYAVMQPNFRGSDGYGEKWLEAGYNQWGGLMQDDVTDATKWLTDSGIADPDRICIIGASYGGYAAMMGAIKTPDLFRCAASFNGVTDMVDLSADFRYRYWSGSEILERVGLEGAEPRDISPLHRSEEIKIPVLLGVSEDDARVDPGQTKRLYSKLRDLKKDVDYFEMKDGGHTLDTADARQAIFENLERFLEKHLATAVAAN